ncbi:soyasapogenol B glucuronide galactosyltransferase [Trifolium repens]|nr:soyasapogenol B glucuronide galactosyltransferase [Trifolium repens]
MEEFGKEAEWLNWLNSKENESVLYVSFGSLTRLAHAQLVEIAHGLENSGHNFIWVVRKNDRDEGENSFLQDFEQRAKESKKGYIIWNWAPQLLILDHPAAVGSKVNKFWLNIGEEKAPRLNIVEEDVLVKREEIVKAVEILMGSGQEGKTMRTRAKKLSDAAKKTVEEGGHSYNNLIQLIDELKSLKIARELEKSKLDN